MPKVIVNDTIREMTAEEVASVNAIAEKECTVADGLIVKGANGNQYKLTVDASGALNIAEVV